MSFMQRIPPPLLTDTYKISHAFMYPEAKQMVAYGEFRIGFEGDEQDTRLVWYGIRFIVEEYISRQWTLQDVDMAEKFFATHNAGFTKFEFPKDLFIKFIKENNGYFPVKIEALPEGTVVHTHVPVYQITADYPYAPLCTFLETVLTMTWYPATVATKSRRAKDLIEDAYAKSVDDDGYWSLESRLHDFGFRGCATVEQATIGGAAHLLNFTGSDTLSAAFYAQFHLNDGEPVASSIPATEHSVMTAHKSERDALLQMISRFGEGTYACVMDSYDYAEALEKVVPSIYKEKMEKGGFLVLRPDSGDQVETVLMGLRAAEKVFGVDMNKKGYKLIRGAGVIQGDGVNLDSLKRILDATLEAGYSAQNVAFGMGGGLLQKVNRDTMSFATKLSLIKYMDGTTRALMKFPKTDPRKFSLPGAFAVYRSDDGIPMVHPKTENSENDPNNLLQIVWNHGPVHTWERFSTLRQRINTSWPALPKTYNVVTPQLQQLIASINNPVFP